MSDRASQVVDEGLPLGISKSYRALADQGDVPRTTLQHSARGRRSLEDKARSQRYLTVPEEKALVDFCAQQDALGRPIRVKYVPSIAFSLACQRSSADRPKRPPGKNWAQLFQKRRVSALRASKSAALDWNRIDIYDKVVSWFDMIGRSCKTPRSCRRMYTTWTRLASCFPNLTLSRCSFVRVANEAIEVRVSSEQQSLPLNV